MVREGECMLEEIALEEIKDSLIEIVVGKDD
jgi:hypothetical protein